MCGVDWFTLWSEGFAAAVGTVVFAGIVYMGVSMIREENQKRRALDRISVKGSRGRS